MTPKIYVKSKLQFAECIRKVNKIKNSILNDYTYVILNVENMKLISEANSAKKAWKQASELIKNGGLNLCL
jgi:hypothetical protein